MKVTAYAPSLFISRWRRLRNAAGVPNSTLIVATLAWAIRQKGFNPEEVINEWVRDYAAPAHLRRLLDGEHQRRRAKAGSAPYFMAKHLLDLGGQVYAQDVRDWSANERAALDACTHWGWVTVIDDTFLLTPLGRDSLKG